MLLLKKKKMKNASFSVIKIFLVAVSFQIRGKNTFEVWNIFIMFIYFWWWRQLNQSHHQYIAAAVCFFPLYIFCGRHFRIWCDAVRCVRVVVWIMPEHRVAGFLTIKREIVVYTRIVVCVCVYLVACPFIAEFLCGWPAAPPDVSSLLLFFFFCPLSCRI